MSHATLGPNALDTAATLRLAQAGGALSAFDGLSRSARDLSTMVADMERDVERLRQRREKPAHGSAVGERLRRERLASEAELLADQVAQLRTALGALRDEAQELGEHALTGSQLAAFEEQIRADDSVCAAAHEDLLFLSEQLGLKRPSPSQARQNGAGGRDLLVPSVLASGVAAVTEDAMQALPANETPHAEPPPELREGLLSTAQQMRTLAYSSRPPKAEQMNGQEPTDSRVAALQSRWATWSERTRAPAVMDPNEMTQWIMRQAYIDNSADMRSFAVKIQFQTSLKGVLRDELNRARQARSELHKGSDSKDKALSSPFARKRVRQDPRVDADGNFRVRPVEDDGEIVDVDQLNDYIRDLETAMSTSSDDMQLSQLELQGMTQRQQQVLNALSNLSKTLHETSMAILRKIGN